LLDEIVANAEELLDKTPPLPQKWVDIRKDLAALQNNRISYADYQTMGAKYQLKPQELETILLYLHNSGDLFYQADTFDQQIILNLDWAIRAVYDILKDKRIKAQHQSESHESQYFTLADLCACFADKDPKEVELYLNFMQSCQLVYEKQKENHNDTSRYVLPRLLPEKPSNSMPSWKRLQQAKIPFTYLQIHYPFLHFSIIEQFIVQVASQLSDCYCWQNGILIHHEARTQSAALVQVLSKKENSSTQDRYLQIEAHGPNKEILVANIRQVFKGIRHFSEEVTERLSLDGTQWVFKSDLDNAKQKEWQERDGSKIVVADFEGMLEAFRQVEEESKDHRGGNWLSKLSKRMSLKHGQVVKKKLKVFVSYSEVDKEHLQELQKVLNLLGRRYPIEAWNDSQILAGDNWNERTQTELEQADMAFFLVSRDFLTSTERWSTFIQQAVERHQNKEDVFQIIPIVVRTCGWKYTELRDVQILPKEGKVLTEYKDKDAFWWEVSNGIAEVLGSL